MMRLVLVLVFAVQAVALGSAAAHELRPGYLDMRETAPDEFAVVWKVPARGDLRLALHVRLPDTCKAKSERVGTFEGAAFFERWTVTCPGNIKGHEITVDGLRTTLTDALVRIAYLGGTTQISRLTPEVPVMTVSGVQTWLEVSGTYFWLGVDHILSGFDHLLFVFALMLLIRDFWMLIKTVTAFTVAHSITLAGATLGYISLAPGPVEAVIALSIAFVASELAKSQSGEGGLSQNYPWVIAFAFGLLHGFGFAGALQEIGLPQTDVPLALLMFNLGVEAGQLMFVAIVLVAFKAITALISIPMAPVRLAAAYAIGTISSYWFLSRVSTF
jgi:hydrogenase/urease accessory protein HupE